MVVDSVGLGRPPANPGIGELSICLEKQWGSIEHRQHGLVRFVEAPHATGCEVLRGWRGQVMGRK